ncbi:MAG: tetratricopeptide repeat protein [Bacteroidales bacterium]|jgi:tetratricopeptide (TPR) repeat protein|nr:tetratricopeptide repeat protein [Bacteroidales bacterium]
MNRLSVITYSLVFTLIFSFSLSAQDPVTYDSPGFEFNSAMELFQKEKYGAAQQMFRYVYENSTDKQHDMKADSYFYMGVCAAYLYNNDAIFLLRDFIRRYPVHAFVPEANYYLGKFYFYKKQYKKALEYYELINEGDIEKEELAEFYFKKGYCYFEVKRLEEARSYFNKAKDAQNDYKYRAIYYLSHIAYQEKEYQAALEGFNSLLNYSEYKEVVPLYITQIYFYQGKYQDVVTRVPAFLDQIPKKERQDMERILALSYYNLGMYEQAAPYFINFMATQEGEIGRSDYYAMGYTFYNLREYAKAIEYLSKTTKEKDEMAQNSFYIIGDCYVQLNKLSLASQSFYEAYKLDFNALIKEDALYNYAKLQYATAATPFSTAIKALENYIEEYPNTVRSEEAKTYLSQIYMSTKNYQAAINSLDKIRSKTPDLLRAYQRCTYFRGLELVNANRYGEAVAMFNKSLPYPFDKDMRLSVMYWRAEAQYREGKFKEAFYDFRAYQQAENVENNEFYPISFYSMGYSALKINNYSEAQRTFSTFLQFKEDESDPAIEADALARLGDAFYMQKELNTAIKYYKECESMIQSNADYALYQQAKCYGFQRKDQDKIAALERMILYYPKSVYSDDAEYELATTYHAQNNYTMAISAYKNFIAKYPKSPYIRQAHNKLAQAYLNSQDEQMAIATFKYVFEKYPGSQEAKDAMANLETIYTEQGNTSDFFDYIKSRNMNVSETKQDSISFKAAESKYIRGDCEASIKSFQGYLKQFPNGLFAAKVHFYKAECEYGMKNYDSALESYEHIVKNYKTEFNETAVQKAASILFNKKEYTKSLAYFKMLYDIATTPQNTLYAQSGIMHCSYALDNYREALAAARNVLGTSSNDQELISEAKLIAGKSALELGDYAMAVTWLNDLAKNTTSEFAAEAAYLSCLIEFKKGDLEACEKRIVEMLSSQYSSGSDYWFAFVIILYGDFYMAKDNFFQARHTYQSIVDSYDGEDLRAKAQSKINQINEIERKIEEKAKDEQLEIEEEF